MYLLLALGICLVVLFVGGALVGFVSGFIDGFNEAAPDTSDDSKNLLFSSGMVLVLLACVILQVVFLRLGYASYTVGRIPKEKRWQVIAWLVLAMAGLAMIYGLMYNPLADSDDAVVSSYHWIKDHPVISLPYLILIEATGDLILFSGVLREILDWKHRPIIVITVFAFIMAVFSGLFSSPMVMIPAYILAIIEGYVYEYGRSVIPVIVCDSVFWLVMVSLLGITLPGWSYFGACVLIVPSTYFALKTMEPYKPID